MADIGNCTMGHEQQMRELELALESANRECQSYKSYYESEKSRSEKLEQENAALKADVETWHQLEQDVCKTRDRYSDEINRLEAENAALRSRPEYTHGYEDGQESRQGEIDALKAGLRECLDYINDGTEKTDQTEFEIWFWKIQGLLGRSK